jgi:hypothetical protein
MGISGSDGIWRQFVQRLYHQFERVLGEFCHYKDFSQSLIALSLAQTESLVFHAPRHPNADSETLLPIRRTHECQGLGACLI